MNTEVAVEAATAAPYTFDMVRASNAPELNKRALAASLQDIIATGSRVLELGSGTGQHIVHFADQMPNVEWQPSDLESNLRDLVTRVGRSGLANLEWPLHLDIRDEDWSVGAWDVIYIGDVLQFLHRDETRHLYSKVAEHLVTDGLLVVYGPVRAGDQQLPPEDEHLDGWIRGHDLEAGIPDLRHLRAHAAEHGLAEAGSRQVLPGRQMWLWKRP